MASDDGHGRVMVVDDDRDAAEVVAEALRLRGFEVAVALGGQDALDAVAAFAPRVVIVDLGMPGVDGYEVARRMRADGFASTLIALSGYSADHVRQAVLAAGFDHFVTKPLRLAALTTLLSP